MSRGLVGAGAGLEAQAAVAASANEGQSVETHRRTADRSIRSGTVGLERMRRSRTGWWLRKYPASDRFWAANGARDASWRLHCRAQSQVEPTRSHARPTGHPLAPCAPSRIRRLRPFESGRFPKVTRLSETGTRSG